MEGRKVWKVRAKWKSFGDFHIEGCVCERMKIENPMKKLCENTVISGHCNPLHFPPSDDFHFPRRWENGVTTPSIGKTHRYLMTKCTVYKPFHFYVWHIIHNALYEIQHNKAEFHSYTMLVIGQEPHYFENIFPSPTAKINWFLFPLRYLLLLLYAFDFRICAVEIVE